MNLSPPTQIAWAIAVILVVVGLIAKLVTIPTLSGLAFWLVLIGAVVLILATLLDDL